MSTSWGPTISTWSEFFPPDPTFTEKDIPDMTGKVIFITGGTSGIGHASCKLLYAKNATICIAGRSQTDADRILPEIKASALHSHGHLHFLLLDLSDLSTLKPATTTFLARSPRLDLLLLNAGVMSPPRQDRNPHRATISNSPLTSSRTTSSPPSCTRSSPPPPAPPPPASVRLVWTSSSDSSQLSPRNGGILWADINFEHASPGPRNFTAYGQSKAGNLLLAAEFTRRYAGSGVLGVSLHPGTVASNLGRYSRGDPFMWLVKRTLASPVMMGAYTLLFAAFTPELAQDGKNGTYVTSWGRFTRPRADLVAEVEAGKDGNGCRLWEWCDEQVAEFV